MQCPVDGETLVMTERSGVEIDYCPKCRGVWLDRGELDKIIERAVPAQPVVQAQPAPGYQPPPAHHPDPRRDDRDHDRRRDWDDDDYRRRPKRRESFLSELFDF